MSRGQTTVVILKVQLTKHQALIPYDVCVQEGVCKQAYLSNQVSMSKQVCLSVQACPPDYTDTISNGWLGLSRSLCHDNAIWIHSRPLGCGELGREAGW